MQLMCDGVQMLSGIGETHEMNAGCEFQLEITMHRAEHELMGLQPMQLMNGPTAANYEE